MKKANLLIGLFHLHARNALVWLVRVSFELVGYLQTQSLIRNSVTQSVDAQKMDG